MTCHDIDQHIWAISPMANVPSKFHWDILKTRPKVRLVLLRQEEEEEEEEECTPKPDNNRIPSPYGGWDNDSCINARLLRSRPSGDLIQLGSIQLQLGQGRKIWYFSGFRAKYEPTRDSGRLGGNHHGSTSQPLVSRAGVLPPNRTSTRRAHPLN